MKILANALPECWTSRTPVTTAAVCRWAWLIAPAIFSQHWSAVMEPNDDPGWKLKRLRPSRLHRLSSSTRRSWLFWNTSEQKYKSKNSSCRQQEEIKSDINTTRPAWGAHRRDRSVFEQTLFRRSTVHQVGPMGKDVSRVKPLQWALLPELLCSLLLESRALPWPLRTQKEGKTVSTHLYRGVYSFPNSTWITQKDRSVRLRVNFLMA